MAAEQTLYSKRELYSTGKQRTFAGPALKEIAFPLGGLGTGTISFGGRGNLRDWEIFNRPNKGSALNFTFFALWVKPNKGEPVARILEGELQPPFALGGGMPPGHLSGVRRLKSATFRGEYPFAWIDLQDDSLPVKVSLEAYNPFIPLNVEDSSIPVVSFQWKITNPSSRPVDLTLAATMHNPVAAQLQDDEQPDPEGYWQNEYREVDQLRGLYFTSTRFPATSANTGTASLCTSHDNVTAQTSWYQGGWWDAAHLFWDLFALEGQLHANTDPAQIRQGSPQASLALHATIRPRGTVTLPVLLTWHTPHLKNGWSRQAVLDTYMKRQFRDAWHAAEYTAAH
ncbi:MAG: hypothetical protein HY318_20905, partial [Armatimonadetes bacterium]|nr:hypothetical protein [Armatimonadota bacterium]